MRKHLLLLALLSFFICLRANANAVFCVNSAASLQAALCSAAPVEAPVGANGSWLAQAQRELAGRECHASVIRTDLAPPLIFCNGFEGVL